MDVDAVFFDAGETLLYPHPSFAELFTEILRAEGYRVDPARIQEVVSASSRSLNEFLTSEEARLWSTSPERSRAMWDRLYRSFLTEVGITEDHDRLVESLYRRFRDVATYRLHPDALPVLRRLRDTEVTIGLISNFEDWLEQLLEVLEVQEFFDVTVISGIEGVEKPDAEIFRIALERAGAVAERSVYVGDNPIFDTDAARAVGMIPVLIDRRGRHPDAEAIRITSLEDLPEAIGLES
ncbi:MAG TPA: HAD-IA family hydrolase [Actinomycetota bacterium]|jgi:putative hydrolase of the HAD superfamily|nr:HAD-IA family hydrolase [Actinomycetota bacterium]